MTWQPIETAPRDRELLLTPGSDREVTIGWYADYSVLGTSKWRSVECDSYDDCCHSATIFPTHWMEVPSTKEIA